MKTALCALLFLSLANRASSQVATREGTARVRVGESGDASARMVDLPAGADQPITLQLKDAKVADVVRTLGALMNMPVYVDPDVAGAVTLELRDVPVSKVLAILSKSSGVSIRVENGKLVASRSTASLLPAVTLPPESPDGPRLPVEDYARAFASPDALVLRARTPESETCSVLEYRSGEPPVFGISTPSGSGYTVTQFGFDPVSGTRYLVVEAERFRKAFSVPAREGVTWEMRKGESSLKVAVASAPGGAGCARAERRYPSPGAPVLLNIELRAGSGSGEVVAAPRIQVRAGQVFSTRSGFEDVAKGQHREFSIVGYVAADGRAAALGLVTTAIYVDPKDGREYVYSQASPASGFVDLSREPAEAAALPAGIASSQPLGLRVWLAE
jgi:hypothetical protein